MIRLTQRDFQILEYLYENGVATFQQICDGFFKSPGSALLRIHHLKKFGFIESRSVSELKASRTQLILFGKKPHKAKIYQLAKAMRAKNPKNDFFLHPTMWKHQIQLGHMRMLLKSIFPHALFLNDSEIRENWKNYKSSDLREPIADLLIEYSDHGKYWKIAIEIERNLKTKEDYFSRFSLFKNSSFTHVIYFCDGEKVFNGISENSAWVRKIGVANLLSPKKIFQKSSGFQSIQNFLGKS